MSFLVGQVEERGVRKGGWMEDGVRREEGGDGPDEGGQLGPPDEKPDLVLGPDDDVCEQDRADDLLDRARAGEAERAQVGVAGVRREEGRWGEVEVGGDV